MCSCSTIERVIVVPYCGSTVERLSAVITAQREIMACGLELQQVMDLTSARSLELTRAEAAVVELREGDFMVYRAAAGTARAALGLRLDLYASLSGRAVLEARALVCVDSEDDPRVDRTAARKVGARSMVCMPLIHEREAVGVLKVYSSAPHAFDADDLTILEQMSGFISAAVSYAAARREREASQQHFGALTAAAKDGIITCDQRGMMIYVNRGAADMFGRRESELMDMAFADLWGIQDSPRPALKDGAGEYQAIERNERVVERRALRADGTDFPVELSITAWTAADHTGHESRFNTAIVRDISERRALTEALAYQLELYGAVTRSLPRGAVVAFDTALRCVAAEGELLDLLRVDYKRMIGRDVLEAAAPDNRAALELQYRKALAGAATEFEVERAGLHLLSRIAPLRGPHGAIIGGLLLSFDVTEQRRQVSLVSAIAANVPNSVIAVFDAKLALTYIAGPKLFEFTHQSAVELLGKPIETVVGPEHAGPLRHAFSGETTVAELTRHDRVFELRVLPIRELNQSVTAGLILIYDVTESRREADELRRAKLLLDAAVANIHDGVALLDEERRILLVNDEYTAIFGLNREQLRGLDRAGFCDLVADRFDDPERFRARILDPASNAPATAEFVMVRPQRRILRTTFKRVGGSHGAGYFVIWRDVTVDADQLAQYERSSLTDALTGVANRRAAQRALDAAYARRARGGGDFSVALFDIDHFKRINDRYGHPVGDRVISAVAGALAAEARGTDLVARWGGEEFIAILPVASTGAIAFCERVRQTIRLLDWRELERVTVSAGVAHSASAEDVDVLLRKADEKLYQAKANGRDRTEA